MCLRHLLWSEMGEEVHRRVAFRLSPGAQGGGPLTVKPASDLLQAWEGMHLLLFPVSSFGGCPFSLL